MCQVKRLGKRSLYHLMMKSELPFKFVNEVSVVRGISSVREAASRAMLHKNSGA